jgi:hypothetical protein
MQEDRKKDKKGLTAKNAESAKIGKQHFIATSD